MAFDDCCTIECQVYEYEWKWNGKIRWFATFVSDKWRWGYLGGCQLCADVPVGSLEGVRVPCASVWAIMRWDLKVCATSFQCARELAIIGQVQEGMKWVYFCDNQSQSNLSKKKHSPIHTRKPYCVAENVSHIGGTNVRSVPKRNCDSLSDSESSRFAAVHYCCKETVGRFFFQDHPIAKPRLARAHGQLPAWFVVVSCCLSLPA